MPKLTEEFVASLAVPNGKNEILVFDEQLPCFGIRKLKTGRATYFVKYRIGSQQRKVTLGIAAPGKLKAMRNAGHDVLHKARLGQDTADELKEIKAKQSATLGELIPRYLVACRPNHKPRSFEEKQRHLTKHWLPLYKLAIEELTRRCIVVELDRIAEDRGLTAADRAKASLSSFLAWCVERDHIEINPVGGISKRSDEEARSRVLAEGELAAIWNACGQPLDYPRIVRLLALTGQRRAEIGGLRWSEIDFERRQIELPPARTKNKQPHLIPLSDAAIAILRDVPRSADRDYVFGRGGSGFSGWSKSKARLDGRLPAEVAEWRLHDLRRTFVTMLGDNGLALPHVIEAVVNHISGHKAGVAGIYNRAAYLPERRRALDLWAVHVESLVSGREAVAIPLTHRK